MIQEALSTPHRYYILTNTMLRAFDNISQREIDAWDMPSLPCSALLISSVNETHWSIVCERHLRTHDMTIPHGFLFRQNDARRPTFISMVEIGVVCGEGCESYGIRLVHCERKNAMSDVYQLGTDVCVRRTKQNGFMQRIPNVLLLTEHEQRGIVIMNSTGQIMAYDPFGLHAVCLGTYQSFSQRGMWLTCIIPHFPLLQRDTDFSCLQCCLISPQTLLLANASNAGSIVILDNRWHWQTIAKRLFILLLLYNIACVLLSM